jgi:hypothetical protein
LNRVHSSISLTWHLEKLLHARSGIGVCIDYCFVISFKSWPRVRPEQLLRWHWLTHHCLTDRVSHRATPRCGVANFTVSLPNTRVFVQSTISRRITLLTDIVVFVAQKRDLDEDWSQPEPGQQPITFRPWSTINITALEQTCRSWCILALWMTVSYALPIGWPLLCSALIG